MRVPMPSYPHKIVIQCSVCGLPWSDHDGEDSTLETCIELLKKELEAAKVVDEPVPMPYVPWYPQYPYQPWWQTPQQPWIQWYSNTSTSTSTKILPEDPEEGSAGVPAV